MLANETSVYVRSMKIQNKMAPPYHGPYKVCGTTENDNYILKTSTGNVLSKNYPLSQLKVVNEEADEAEVFETILEHRIKRGGRMEYLVKYANKSIAEATWVKEAHFTTTDLIEAYWEHTSAPENDTVNFVIATTKHQTRHSISRHIRRFISTIFLLSCIQTAKSQMIEGPFQLCDTNNKILVITELFCSNKQYVDSKLIPDRGLWHIFEKRKNKVHGTAHICKKYLVKAVADTSFFGHEYLSVQTIPIPLSAQECRKMVADRLCGTETMFCIEDTCTYHRNPEVKFSWMQTKTTEAVNCFIGTMEIQAVDESVTLFEGVQGKCQPLDLCCRTSDSTIVWSPRIIHKCQLEIVESGIFARRNNIIYTENGVSTRFSQNSTNLLFQLKQKVELCGIQVYETAQGFYVTGENINCSRFDQTIVDPIVTQHLILADGDYSKFILDTNLHQVAYEQSEAQCYLLQSLLHNLEMFEDSFNFVTDLNGKSFITYTLNNNLYIPRCTNVSTIYLLNSSTCFQDYPILINQKHVNTTAFLTRTGILRKSSVRIPCDERIIESNIQNKYWISMKTGIVVMTHLNNQSLFRLTSHENHWILQTYQHDSKFAEEAAFFDHHETSIPLLVDGMRFQTSGEINPDKTIKFLDTDYFSSSDLKMKMLIIFLVVILKIIIIIVIVCLLCYWCKCRRDSTHIHNWMHNRTKRENTNV